MMQQTPAQQGHHMSYLSDPGFFLAATASIHDCAATAK